MKDLYIETNYGVDKIDESIVNKYNLEKGLSSPFTRKRIVDKDGNYLVFHSDTKDMMEHPDDGIAQMERLYLDYLSYHQQSRILHSQMSMQITKYYRVLMHHLCHRLRLGMFPYFLHKILV